MQEAILSYLRHGQTPFFRLPSTTAPAAVDVALLGVPHDGGATYQPGVRLAPYHVRRVSALVQGHHPDHGLDVFRQLRCVDGGNVVFPPFDRAAMRAAVELCGADLVEYCPSLDHADISAHLSAHLVWEMLAAIAVTRR